MQLEFNKSFGAERFFVPIPAEKAGITPTLRDEAVSSKRRYTIIRYNILTSFTKL